MEDKHKMLIEEMKRNFFINNNSRNENREKGELRITDLPSKENPADKTTQEGSEEKSVQGTKQILLQLKSNRHCRPLCVGNEKWSDGMHPENKQIQHQDGSKIGPEAIVIARRIGTTNTAIARSAAQMHENKVREPSQRDKQEEMIELRRHMAIHSVQSKTEPEQGNFSRDSLRRKSAMSVIKKMKDKVQDLYTDKLKPSNENEFKTYLAPEININEDEHRRALENFRIITRHNMILENGHHFKVSSYTAYNFTINNYIHKKNEHRMGNFDYFLSNPLKVFDGQLQLKVYLNKRSTSNANKYLPYLTVELCRTEGELADRAISTRDLNPFYMYHRRTILINNTITIVDEPPFSVEWPTKWMQEVYRKPKGTAHHLVEKDLQDDRISIQLIFEPLLPLIKFYISNDGILTWTIEQFTQKWTDEKNGIIQCQYSPYFYSSAHGHRMRVRLYLNGNGVAKGTHLSIFLDFLVGEWDDSLPPLQHFPHRTTFMILDQSDLPEKKAIVASETNKDGYPTDFFYDFANQSQIKEDLYLKNDILQMRVIVEPIKESKLL